MSRRTPPLTIEGGRPPNNRFLSPDRAYLLTRVLAMVCIGGILISLAAYRPYQYAISVSSTWQGAIEIGALTALLLAAQRVARGGWLLFAMAIPAELFLRRHGVDLAALIDLIYLEVLIGVGSVISSWMKVQAQRTVSDYLRRFVLGLAVWSFLAWTMSALGPGSLIALRGLTILLAVIVIAHRPVPASIYAIRRATELNPASRTIVILIGIWLLVLFAKTSVAINFDALWYGLRGEHVLVGAGSAFKSVGLVSAVYYFPKLYELLLIPVSGLGNSSVIAGMSIAVLAMFAFACHAATVALGVASATMRMAIVLVCVTIPVVANSAIDPKPDLLAAALLMAAAIHTGDFLTSRSRSALLWAGACALLSIQCKLVALPYVGLMTVALAYFLIRRRNNLARSVPPAAGRDARLVFGLSIFVTLLITLRTFLLAGVPTIGPDALLHLWRVMGFELKFPAGSLLWTLPQDWSDVPSLIFDVLFRPQRADHIVNFWTGNVWLWAFLAAAVFAPTRAWRAINPAPLIALACCGPILLCAIAYYHRGGDGNYYLAAATAATLLSVSTLANRLPRHAMLLACLAAFIAFDAGYSFISADWTPGTRAFDLNFGRSFVEYRRNNRQLMSTNGLSEIDDHLRHMRPDTRVIGCLDDDINMRIGARTESIQHIFYSRPDFLGGTDVFLRFLHDDAIRFLIVPRNTSANTYCMILPQLRAAMASVAADPAVTRIDDRNYVMYDLDAWLRKPRP